MISVYRCLKLASVVIEFTQFAQRKGKTRYYQMTEQPFVDASKTNAVVYATKYQLRAYGDRSWTMT